MLRLGSAHPSMCIACECVGPAPTRFPRSKRWPRAAATERHRPYYAQVATLCRITPQPAHNTTTPPSLQRLPCGSVRGRSLVRIRLDKIATLAPPLLTDHLSIPCKSDQWRRLRFISQINVLPLGPFVKPASHAPSSPSLSASVPRHSANAALAFSAERLAQAFWNAPVRTSKPAPCGFPPFIASARSYISLSTNV